MKTLFKTITILCITLSLVNCNNDTPTTPNLTTCNYQGFTFLDTNNNTQTVIPESDLTTDFFNTSSNGPEVEIYQTSNPGGFNFTTTVTTLNGTGTGTLNYNGNTYTVNVTCQRTGTSVGDELRYDVTASGLEVEFCVIIDVFH
tara:strand:+ start:2758 stop:3189 length:432 start_codon:yes stop_codon:yes gene_type:complete